MVISVNPEQPLKADSPIAVTESGIDISVNPEHPLNASLWIDVIHFGISIEKTSL